MSDLQRVGPVFGGTGTAPPFTATLSGAQRISDAHGRYFIAAIEGRLFSTGSGATALSANTIGLTATATPIVGVYNPIGSTFNLSILQISAQVYVNTLTSPVGSGPLVIAAGVTTVNISTGSVPLNRKTLTFSGSVAKAFPGGVALTGLTPSLTIIEGADIQNTTSLTHGVITAVTEQFSIGGVQNFDGSLIVPPGGLVVLLNTTSTTTCSIASRMLWEELPVLT